MPGGRGGGGAGVGGVEPGAGARGTVREGRRTGAGRVAWGARAADGAGYPRPDPPPQGGRELEPEAKTAQFAGVLAVLLCDPKTVELVETAPETGRVLRSLCHLLGVETPAFLRRRGAAESPPPQLAPGSILGSSPRTGAGLPPLGAERNAHETGVAVVEEAAASEAPPAEVAP